MDGDPDDQRGDDAAQRAQIRSFMIADVRGYTLFTQERGDETAAKLAATFADIARDGVEGRGGTLLELRGDEALCVFSSARDAIRAAVDLPAAVRRRDDRHVHVGRNETSGTVELGVVLFGVPIGGSPRIDQPQPANCAIT